MFLPNKNGKNHPPKSPSQSQKSKINSKKSQGFFTFVLPVPGGRMHEHVHSVLSKIYRMFF